MRRSDSRAEMPFLEHLEELRWRILWSLAALVVGAVAGFWAVQHFDVIGLLKRPIQDFLPSSRLFYTHPTDAFVITLKLSLMVGGVLASPVIIWQGWAFFSPALYAQEKRYIVPVLFGGLVLFVAGVTMAYVWVLPAAFRILLGFQPADFEPLITADNYFGFALQIMLAFGLCFELPLVIMMLAVFGVVTPKFLATNRRYWIVIAAIGAAFITPTPDALTMLLMMVPLVLLYEVGILLARIVSRRREKETEGAGAGSGSAIVVLLVAGLAAPVRAQVVGQQPRPLPGQTVQDTTRASAPGTQPIDTGAARRMGLPTAPSRALPGPDSVMQELLKRKGYQVTRFGGDSVTFHADTRRIDLSGSALVEREGSTLEADTVAFAQAECQIVAGGEPKLFDQGTVLIGEGMRYDTCERRGTVTEALTRFNQSGVAWFLRGRLSIDSASTRIYAGGSSITSSDLPLPDYHFSANRVKWVTNTIMVARPAVLYVRDVPVLWLPFIFQDMRRGRRSGLLIPRFGINDLVRTNPGYRRHVSNVGYYVAINDYLDAQAALDWSAGQSVAVNGQMQYRWLDRFINGNLAFARMYELGGPGGGGRTSSSLLWNHQQQFNLRTRLSASINYATSTQVLQRNSIDPYLTTANLRSTANFSKQYGWGTVTLGGNRGQELSSGVVTLTLPTVSVSPAPVNLSPSITWSPSFNFSNDRTSHQFAGTLSRPPELGIPRTDSLFATTENTSMQIGTPFRFGRWSIPLNGSVAHSYNDRRSSVSFPDPADSSRTITRFYGEDFNTALDWNTQLSLPTLFTSTWKLQPSVGIQNSTGGAFALRNRNSGGAFVTQGKRLSFAASISPALFGFFPGIGPLSRIRHSVSPSLTWSYAPPAKVPEAYARALDPTGRSPQRQSPRSQLISLGLSQTFEGKFRQPPEDSSSGAQARKIKLLSIQTTQIQYNFEQAKLPGRNGWTTQQLSNQLSSDLLPGFSLAMSHDLWDGPVGYDSIRFSPFLTNVSARFTISGATVRGLAGLLTGRRDARSAASLPQDADTTMRGVPQRLGGPVGTGLGGLNRLGTVPPTTARRQFMATVDFEDQRQRPDTTRVGQTGNRSVIMGFAFSPTPGWSVTWNTQYNITAGEFGQHDLRLERDLRRWHATFAFVKTPNGNFGFNFFITLLDQQAIKFQYDQRTVNR